MRPDGRPGLLELARRVRRALPERAQPDAVAVVEREVRDVGLERRALHRFVGPLGAGAREGDPAQDLVGAALGLVGSPGDGVAEEEQRQEVQEQDQEQRHPEEEARLPAERAGNGRRPERSRPQRPVPREERIARRTTPRSRRARGRRRRAGASCRRRRARASAPRRRCCPAIEAAKSVDEDAERSEQRADHAEHLHVAQAHALLSRDLLVEKRQQPEPAGAEGGAERGLQRRAAQRRRTTARSPRRFPAA